MGAVRVKKIQKESREITSIAWHTKRTGVIRIVAQCAGEAVGTPKVVVRSRMIDLPIYIDS